MIKINLSAFILCLFFFQGVSTSVIAGEESVDSEQSSLMLRKPSLSKHLPEVITWEIAS